MAFLGNFIDFLVKPEDEKKNTPQNDIVVY
jgi:hypothetical protein